MKIAKSNRISDRFKFKPWMVEVAFPKLAYLANSRLIALWLLKYEEYNGKENTPKFQMNCRANGHCEAPAITAEIRAILFI